MASKFKNDGEVDGGAKFVKSKALIKFAGLEPRDKLAMMWAQTKA